MNSFDWGVIWYSIPYLLQGAVVTLEISALAMVFGTIIGISAGLLSLSDMKLITLLVRAYVYFVRGTPALVQVFLVYFALPEFGLELSSFWSGVVALSFNAGGFIAAKFTPFELYALLAVFYLVMISALSKLSEYVEARLA